MQRLLIYLLISLILLLCWSCQSFIDPQLDNPNDTTSVELIAPVTIILDGPEYNSTVTSPDVTFRWTGNESAYEYKYLFDNLEWSAWSTDTVARFQYLDENYHVFSIKSRTEKQTEEDSIHVRIFTVNAIDGPALRFYPRHINVSTNEVFTIEVYAEEVSDVAGVYLEIPMNPAGLEYISHIVYTSGDAFLAKGSDNVLSVEETDESQLLKISLARVSGSAPEVSGTGALVQMIYRYVGTENTEIDFSTECQFQNEQMEKFIFSELVGCIVDKKQ